MCSPRDNALGHAYPHLECLVPEHGEDESVVHGYRHISHDILVFDLEPIVVG
jgi:hypothetical protein